MKKLPDFLKASLSPWHACHEIKSYLKGYQPLSEKEPWHLQMGKGYYVERGASLIAFRLPTKKLTSSTTLAAHTDSPSLLLKPHGEFEKEGVRLLNFEIYGAPILPSWVGLKLTLAGRLFYEKKDGTIAYELVSFDDYPITIPHLAFHLDRSVNESGLMVNKQEQLSAVACLQKELKKHKSFLEMIFEKKCGKKKITHFELFATPARAPYFLGVNSELLASPRLDNLVSSHAACKAFLETKPSTENLHLLCLWNHEEIGSESYEGAKSSFFQDLLERVTESLKLTHSQFLQLKAHSMALSIDVAHAVHPTFPDKSEPRHKPAFGSGVLLKSNANQRYAGFGELMARFLACLQKEKITHGQYVARGDYPAGSTLGPLHAAKTGIQTLDIGIPILSMHSSQELMAMSDYTALTRALSAALTI